MNQQLRLIGLTSEIWVNPACIVAVIPNGVRAQECRVVTLNSESHIILPMPVHKAMATLKKGLAELNKEGGDADE